MLTFFTTNLWLVEDEETRLCVGTVVGRGDWFRGEKCEDLDYRRRQNGEEGTHQNDIKEFTGLVRSWLKMGSRKK